MLQDVIYKYLIPLLIYGFITGLANLLLSKKSQVELWAESHPKAAAVQKLLRAIGLDPWQIVSAVSLWATSRLPDAQRSEFLKATDPKPAAKPPSNPMGPMGGMLALCALLSVTSCSIFGSHGSFWPKVEHCAPSPASLVSQVADILLAGGDYEAALKAQAERDGAAAVLCAVQAATDSLTSKVGSQSNAGPAVARGKAFLAKHEASK